MNSLDTNVLYYATNADCQEHPWARSVLEELLAAPSERVIADQVLCEYYRLVRNPMVNGRNLEYYRYDGGPIRGSREHLEACMASVKVEEVFAALSEALP